LKRLLDEDETGLSRPNSRRMMIIVKKYTNAHSVFENLPPVDSLGHNSMK
jgi:hypothetical protein